jgi:Na+/proline symporter
MVRSVIAVVVGYMVLATATMAKFAAMQALFPGALPAPGEDVFPSTFWLVTILLSDVALMIVAGYVTAAVAKRTEVVHAAALGGVMVVLGLVLMFVNWLQEPLWYQITLVAIAIPAAVTGGSLRSHQRADPTWANGRSRGASR